MPDLDFKNVTYVSVEDIAREPGEGFWYVLTDRWWSHDPDKGVLLYRKSPQCNKNKTIADKITQSCYPGLQTIFIERAYLKHDCADYI